MARMRFRAKKENKVINKLYDQANKVNAFVVLFGYDEDGDPYALVELDNGTPSKAYYNKEEDRWF